MSTTRFRGCETRLHQAVEQGWEVISHAPLIIAPPVTGPGFRSNLVLFAPDTKTDEIPEPAAGDVVLAEATPALGGGRLRQQVVLSTAPTLAPDGAAGVTPILQELLAADDVDDETFQVVASVTATDTDVFAPIMAEMRSVIEGSDDV